MISCLATKQPLHTFGTNEALPQMSNLRLTTFNPTLIGELVGKTSEYYGNQLAINHDGTIVIAPSMFSTNTYFYKIDVINSTITQVGNISNRQGLAPGANLELAVGFGAGDLRVFRRNNNTDYTYTEIASASSGLLGLDNFEISSTGDHFYRGSGVWKVDKATGALTQVVTSSDTKGAVFSEDNRAIVTFFDGSAINMTRWEPITDGTYMRVRQQTVDKNHGYTTKGLSVASNYNLDTLAIPFSTDTGVFKWNKVVRQYYLVQTIATGAVSSSRINVSMDRLGTTLAVANGDSANVELYRAGSDGVFTLAHQFPATRQGGKYVHKVALSGNGRVLVYGESQHSTTNGRLLIYKLY